MTYSSIAKLLAPVLVGTFLVIFPVTAGNVTTDKPYEQPKTEPVVIINKKPIKKIQGPLVEGDCTKYADLIDKYDWPTSTAMSICGLESSGDPGNINWNDPHYDSKGKLICKTSAGLMQISCEWGYTLEELTDPVKNIEVAYQIYASGGFSPWTTYKKVKKIGIMPILDLGIVK